MELIFKLILGCLLLDAIILTISYIGVRFARRRWPGWWERWIVASYPEDFE